MIYIAIFFVTPKAKVEKTSVVKSEKAVLVASADNTATLPMFAKLSSDIDTTDTNTPTMEEIKTSKENLRGSVGNLKDKIDVARRENSKEINGLRLELIQLMEQGNQVVKSPWASWQFGMNYFYDNWGSSYKGRGDKQGDKVFQRDNTMGRYQTNTSNGKYGTTDLDLLSTAEPKSEITVNASIRAKSIDKEAPNLQLPRVTPPASPQLNLALESPAAIPTIEVEAPKITLSLPEPNASPFTDYSFQNGKQKS